MLIFNFNPPALPIQQFKKSSHAALLICSKGGHIGFMDSIGYYDAIFPSVPFFSERLAKQYISALIKFDDIKEIAG